MFNAKAVIGGFRENLKHVKARINDRVEKKINREFFTDDVDSVEYVVRFGRFYIVLGKVPFDIYYRGYEVD